MLQESEARYKESKQKKWIIMVLGTILAGFLGYYVPIGITALSSSQYDRKTYDDAIEGLLGNFMVEDALTDNVMMVSYSWNAAEPRFYTKGTSRADPGVYNVSLALAAEASTATPYYFQPKVFTNQNGTEEVLIDGSLIANNPAMYAYVSATLFANQTNVRIISLGSGA
jgi:patatin-like phospholipase/acyl hydrolase